MEIKYTDAYIDILNTYKEQINSSVNKKNYLKEQFYKMIKLIMYILTWLFVGSIAASIVLFIIIILNDYSSASIITGAITAIISSFITMVLSIFKLPKIIAKYLFNKKEDELMRDIIGNIQTYEINAVKYEIENIRIEKIGHEIAKSEIASGDNNDGDLLDSSYDIPSDTNSVQNSQNGNLEENDNVS